VKLRNAIVITAAALGLAATAKAQQLCVDMSIKGGPGFFLGLQTGRFMPGIGLGFDFGVNDVRDMHRDSFGAPESTWTEQQTHLTITPEIGTRIYLSRRATWSAPVMRTYLWLSGFTSFYNYRVSANGEPDTARNREYRWQPNGGGRLGFGAECLLLPDFAVKGGIGLTGQYRTDLAEQIGWQGEFWHIDRRNLSVSQYAELGVSYYFF